MIKTLKKYLAFTLSELMVALSILGVVLAIAVPVVTTLAPNKEMIKFKKAYGDFVRITNEMLNNDDLYPNADTQGFRDTSSFRRSFRGNSWSGQTKFARTFGLFLSLNDSTNTNPCLNREDSFFYTTNDMITFCLPNIPEISATQPLEPENRYEISIIIDDQTAVVDPGEGTVNQFNFQIDSFGRVHIDTDNQNGCLAAAYLNEVNLRKSQGEIWDDYCQHINRSSE